MPMTPYVPQKLNRFKVMPWADEIPKPPKGLAFNPVQPTAIKFALDRNRSYLALEQGLGKTICAAIISKAFKSGVVYLCPPFLVANVINEFKTWAPDLIVSVYKTPKKPKIYKRPRKIVEPIIPNVLVIPDSLLKTKSLYEYVLNFIRWWGEYYSVLIIDEAHRYKEDEAIRTKYLFGHFKSSKVIKSEDDKGRIKTTVIPAVVTPALVDLFDRQILMSGTPMPNSPIEMYGMFNKLVPELIGYMSRYEYGKRYCAAYKKRFGWDYSGSSNEVELQRKIIYPKGPFMLRIRKDAIPLPPKIESVFVVSDKMSPRLAGLDKKIGKTYSKEKDSLKIVLQLASKTDLHTMEYRRLLGIEKVRHALPYYESIMDDTKEKIIIFAHHTEVIEKLSAALKKYNPLVITGKVLVAKRQELVNKFQSPKSKHRIFIGNYKAMGVGFTLTAASRVLFHEYDYVPGVNNQAADRAHRYGQTKTVYVQYIVYQDSLDKSILEAVLKKSKSINKILEGND